MSYTYQDTAEFDAKGQGFFDYYCNKDWTPRSEKERGYEGTEFKVEKYDEYDRAEVSHQYKVYQVSKKRYLEPHELPKFILAEWPGIKSKIMR